VWVGLLVLQDLGVLLDRGSTVEDSGLDLWHVLAESGVFVLDLVGQLASVAHDENRALSRDRLNLLKGGQNKDGSLTKTGLGLTENVGSENCLRDTHLLDCRIKRAESDIVFSK
jgi:hypothetical protein